MSADIIEYVDEFGKHNKKKILVVDDFFEKRKGFLNGN